MTERNDGRQSEANADGGPEAGGDAGAPEQVTPTEQVPGASEAASAPQAAPPSPQSAPAPTAPATSGLVVGGWEIADIPAFGSKEDYDGFVQWVAAAIAAGDLVEVPQGPRLREAVAERWVRSADGRTWRLVEPDATSTGAFLHVLPDGTSPAAPKAKRKRTRNTIIIGAVAAVLVGVLVRIAFGTIWAPGPSQQAIDDLVVELKGQITLPLQIDAYTVMEDVVAEEGAIHYQYSLAGIEGLGLTDEALKQSTVANVCNVQESRAILDDDVTMRYSYEADTGETFGFDLTDDDC